MPSILENIKKLQQERASTWEKAKPLVDLLQTENRDFTAEERSTFDALNADLDQYKNRIDALQRARETEEAVTAFRTQIEGTEDIVGELDAQLRGLLSRNSPTTSLDLTFTSKMLKRALSVGTPTAGGNTVPTTFWPELIQPLRSFSSILQAGARIITTTSGEPITLPRLSSPGSAVQVAEATTITGTDPTFDSLQLAVWKFGEIIKISNELATDSAVDIESLVADLIGQNIGILLGAKLATGTGTGETAGLFTVATVGKTGATGTAGVPTFDDLIDLFYSVTGPYRANGKWITSDLAMASLRKVKDSQGQYIWQPAVTADTPDLILGKPVFTDSNVAGPALNGKSVVFGDISKYWVRMVNSLKIDRSDHAAFNTDEVAFRGTLRAGGALTDASAVKAFRGGAS
jgi:HK97 family phage major capsid protein